MASDVKGDHVPACGPDPESKSWCGTGCARDLERLTARQAPDRFERAVPPPRETR